VPGRASGVKMKCTIKGQVTVHFHGNPHWTPATSVSIPWETPTLASIPAGFYNTALSQECSDG